MKFQVIDYVVLLLYLVAITAFGSWFGRSQKTIKDYFLSDRNIPWWAICCCIVATETSTLTFVGVPATAYSGNMTFIQLVAGYVIGRILVSLLFIPAYFKGEIFTSYELMRIRFGSRVKNFTAGLFLITRSLADGVRLFAVALVLSVVTGVPEVWAVLIIGLVMIIYTVYGGQSAVIWTDVVQMFVYLLGASIAFFALLNRIPGGWSEVFAVAGPAGRLQFLDFSWDLGRTYTLWAGVLGGIFLTMATHGTDQFLVQRLLSARSAGQASTGLVLSGFIVFGQFVLFLFIGVLLFVFYQKFPLATPLEKADEIFPTFIVSSLAHGVSGFIIAAIVAAALSPSLNSLASTTMNDFYLQYIRPGSDERHNLVMGRFFTLWWGVVQLFIAMAARNWGSVLNSGLAILSIPTGAVLGIFLLGVLTRHRNQNIALVAMVVGLATVGFLYLQGVAWTWWVFAGAVSTFLVGVVLQRIVGPQSMNRPQNPIG